MAGIRNQAVLESPRGVAFLFWKTATAWTHASFCGGFKHCHTLKKRNWSKELSLWARQSAVFMGKQTTSFKPGWALMPRALRECNAARTRLCGSIRTMSFNRTRFYESRLNAVKVKSIQQDTFW